MVARGHLLAARRRGKRNGGRPGSDGRTVEAWPGDLRAHGPQIRAARRAGTYRPSPAKRVAIPTPGGGVRQLGRPTGLDRVLQQARLQVRQPEWDTTCSESREGFRPGGSAHQAGAQAQRSLGAGDGWGVDLDLEQCVDRVNHDTRMRLVKKRVADRRVLQRIDRSLKAGAGTDAGVEATVEGTPPGGPRSPLWAHRRLDGLDKAWERRGHRFVRDAEEGHSYVKSLRAGQRGRARVTRFLARRLTLRVNAAKRAVDRPWRRPLLGCTCTGHGPNRRRVREKALKACTHEGRRVTSRTRGGSWGRVVGDVRRYLEGWYVYCGFTEAPACVKELDSWIGRRRRGSLGKPWGRRRDRERRRRGVSRDLAGNTVKSAHGPWRLSHRPALAIALPGSDCEGLGLPRLHPRSRR